MRRVVAGFLAAVLIVTGLGLSGCSEPVDTGSQTPAASQPILAALALVGLGIGIVAFIHHGNNHGGSPTPASAVAPAYLQVLTQPGADLSLDPTTTGGVGALEKGSSSHPYRFEEVVVTTRTTLGYNLPTGYAPTAVAIDGSANDWFVDANGSVEKCAAPVSGGPTVCAPTMSFSDGITGAGGRSIAADPFYLFDARDNGSGTVFWAAFPIGGGTKISGSYTYSGMGLAASDAVSATTFSSTTSSFVLIHKDGSSYAVSLPSTVSKASYLLSPVPDLAPGSVSVSEDSSADLLYLGFSGPTTGTYEIGEWIGANGLGIPAGTIEASIIVAVNGQVNTSTGSFALPLSAMRSDLAQDTYMLDADGQLVGFAPPP
jgi:hypothetical protein